MKKFSLFFAIFITIININAQPEARLRISNNEILGLHEKYKNIKVNWKKNSIFINDKEVKFPDFTKGILDSKTQVDTNGDLVFLCGIKWKLTLEASLGFDINEKERFPDYISFIISPENKDYYFTITFDLEKQILLNSTVTLNTYSKDKGDKWVNENEKILDTLSSTYMNLILSPEQR